MAIVAFAFWRKKPRFAPSATSEAAPTLNCWSSVKDLLSIKNYVLLLLSFNMIWSVYGTMGSIMSSLTQPYNFTPTDNTLFTIAFVFFGLVASAFIVRKAVRDLLYRKVHLTISVFACLNIFLCYLALNTQNRYVMIVANASLGASVLPFLPLSLVYGTELTYPQGQAMMGGLLVASSQGFAVVVLLLVQYAVDSEIIYGMLLLGGITALNIIISFFIEQDLRRERAESTSTERTYSHLKESMM